MKQQWFILCAALTKLLITWKLYRHLKSENITPYKSQVFAWACHRLLYSEVGISKYVALCQLTGLESLYDSAEFANNLHYAAVKQLYYKAHNG